MADALSRLTGRGTRTDGADLPDDPRLLAAAQEYLRLLEQGRRPLRQEFLGRYPDLADPLGECLDGLDLVHHAAARDRRRPEEAPSPVSGTPEPLGDFKLLREIGHGGMGVVYEAVQLSLGRRVAVKVLPFAATLDARQLQRFHNEAQAAAQLHHTNIVPVYQVGCERGVHFYAMQLIEGQPLSVAIQQMREQLGRTPDRGEPSSPSPAAPRSQARTDMDPPTAPYNRAGAETVPPVSLALTTQRSGKQIAFFRTAASLIVQAAQGLEHAHQYGIIHRDIKPGNLLVDTHGRLWITDFGVAHFHTDAGLTQTGDILGTLRYMSPEQAQGQRGTVDPRTDVYSLGATLYELTTLEPIFSGDNRHALLQQIVRQEPRSPRAVDQAVPYELETIILKAVAKNPGERYASAKELAADLQRYLDDKPILAKRPRLLERARKWMRRHPAVLGASVVLLILLALGSALGAWLIRGEQQKTQHAFEKERQRAEEAESRYRLAKRSVDEMIQLAEEELSDAPHMQGVRKRVLEIALGYYQEFIAERRHEPDAPELAATRDRVKKILSDLAVLQGDSHLVLLNEPDVLKDLKVTQEQRDLLGDLFKRQGERRQEAFPQFAKLEPEERRALFVKLAQKNEADLAEILSMDQVRRLGQVALQARGFMALVEPDIAAALELKAVQRERIRGVESEAFMGKGDRPPFGKPGGFSRKGWDRELALETANKKVQAILTKEQLERWNQMIGPPFRGRLALRPSGPLGPPPGPIGPPGKGFPFKGPRG